MSVHVGRPPSGSAEDSPHETEDHAGALNPVESLATGIERTAPLIMKAHTDGIDHSDVRDMAVGDVQVAVGNTVLALYMDLRRSPAFWAWVDRRRSVGTHLAAFLLAAALMAGLGLVFGAPGLFVPGYVLIPMTGSWLGHALCARLVSWRYRVRPPQLGGTTYSVLNSFLAGVTIAYLAAAPMSDNWRWEHGVYFVPLICAFILTICFMPWMYLVAKDAALGTGSDPASEPGPNRPG